MAAAGGSASGAKTDKKWHNGLLQKISKMLRETDFRKLKHLFYNNDQVARKEIDEIDDIFLFLALLERRDHISVGRYDVLIDHLETLELNDCIRVIREHTDEIKKCRQKQASGGATSGTEEGLLESRQLRMVEELVDKKLQDEKLSKQMIEDLINKKLHGQLSKQTVEDLVHKKFQEFQASENQTRQVTKVRYVAPPSADVNKYDETRQVTKTRYVAPPSADVNRYEGRETPLMRAAENNDVARVRSLIEAGADLDMKSNDGFERTALILASIEGHTEVVAELIKAGANVDIQYWNGFTALILAAMNGHKEVVAKLIKAGADLNIRDKVASTALILAARYGHKEVVAKLIEAGADLNIRDEFEGKTALDYAMDYGHIEIAEMLKSAGTTR